MLRNFPTTFALFCVVLSGCGQTEREEKSTSNNASNHVQAVSESEKLPDFTLTTLSGNTINLRQLEGQKVVVVNFWATWCGPCRHEIPDFNGVYSRYRDRGVEILGVSVDQYPESVLPPFLEKIPITYPVLLGSPEMMYRYDIRALPTTFVIDRSGRIANRIVGMTSAAKLEAELKKLL
jgi:peroxiredoxin